MDRTYSPGMPRRAFVATMAGVLIAAPVAAGAQQTQQRYRVGVVLQGGPFYAMIDGFRDGLKDLGFEEGRQYLLHIRDVKGDPKALQETARALEQEKVDVIYSLSTSVTLAVKQATASVPIVFYVGTDPVVVGLVKSYAKPGGRLTGVHSQTTELDSKRLEILKEMFPKLRRVATFYAPAIGPPGRARDRSGRPRGSSASSSSSGTSRRSRSCGPGCRRSSPGRRMASPTWRTRW